MTRGGAKRAARRAIRALCAKIGHRWTGDKQQTCEACGVPKP